MRTKKVTLKMRALDWLNKCGRILRGAIQPIECVLFASLLLSFSLSLQCDLALRMQKDLGTEVAHFKFIVALFRTSWRGEPLDRNLVSLRQFIWSSWLSFLAILWAWAQFQRDALNHV